MAPALPFLTAKCRVALLMPLGLVPHLHQFNSHLTLRSSCRKPAELFIRTIRYSTRACMHSMLFMTSWKVISIIQLLSRSLYFAILKCLKQRKNKISKRSPKQLFAEIIIVLIYFYRVLQIADESSLMLKACIFSITC